MADSGSFLARRQNRMFEHLGGLPDEVQRYFNGLRGVLLA